MWGRVKIQTDSLWGVQERKEMMQVLKCWESSGLLNRVCLILPSVLVIKAEVLLLMYGTHFTICVKLLACLAKPLLLYPVNQCLIFKIVNLGDRDLHQPTDSLIYWERKMSPFPVKEKNRTALKCGASSVNTQLSILCGENWVYKWPSCANFSVGHSNLPLNAVIYFHWFPAVMDFAWTTSLYLTLRMKHMSACVHLCSHKHTLYYDNDHLPYYFFSLKALFV